MLKAIRTRATWMAIGLVLGGGALASAGVVVVDRARGDAAKAPEASLLAPGRAVSQEARADDAHRGRALGHAKQGAKSHPVNHGYYVSRAAHCEDVDDPENDVHFNAPANCATDGAAHGEYVSKVAESNAGKKPGTGDGSGD